MKTNKTISIEIDLLRRVSDKMRGTDKTFSGLVEELLEKWESSRVMKGKK